MMPAVRALSSRAADTSAAFFALEGASASARAASRACRPSPAMTSAMLPDETGASRADARLRVLGVASLTAGLVISSISLLLS
jgi:hypothetical protein